MSHSLFLFFFGDDDDDDYDDDDYDEDDELMMKGVSPGLGQEQRSLCCQRSSSRWQPSHPSSSFFTIIIIIILHHHHSSSIIIHHPSSSSSFPPLRHNSHDLCPPSKKQAWDCQVKDCLATACMFGCTIVWTCQCFVWKKLISQSWVVQNSQFLEEMTLTHYILMSLIFRSHLPKRIEVYFKFLIYGDVGANDWSRQGSKQRWTRKWVLC